MQFYIKTLKLKSYLRSAITSFFKVITMPIIYSIYQTRLSDAFQTKNKRKQKKTCISNDFLICMHTQFYIHTYINTRCIQNSPYKRTHTPASMPNDDTIVVFFFLIKRNRKKRGKNITRHRKKTRQRLRTYQTA